MVGVLFHNKIVFVDCRHWPCGVGFVLTSLLFVPLSILASVLFRRHDICISQAEREARQLIDQFSLRACLYDNHIRINIRKSLFSSWIEFHVPKEFVERRKRQNTLRTSSSASTIDYTTAAVEEGRNPMNTNSLQLHTD